ncbi:MAG: AAA family ATPase [Candidatus Bathyarchaeia archaeon]
MINKDLYAKLCETRRLIETAFFHDAYYLVTVLAAFVSRSHICLLGTRGTGKTHLAKCLLRTVDPSITATQQGYLSADFEQVLAAPKVAQLMLGIEEVTFRKLATARLKMIDEIQRLGMAALSAFFRILDDGAVEYLGQERQVEEHFTIATANPTERDSDTLNITIPEPLWDRFAAVIWVPIARLKDQMKINGNVKKALDAIQPIWTEKDLLALWNDVRENVTVSKELEYTTTLMLRIPSICIKGQGLDGSSLEPEKKRAKCAECNQNYLCSKVLTPPSLRLKLAYLEMSKGFAYVDGRDSVNMKDLEDAFPVVFWKRIVFMDEDEITDRLTALRAFFKLLTKEMHEAQEAVELAYELKQKYTAAKMQELETAAKAKVWLIEAVDDVKSHQEHLRAQLKTRHAQAKQKNDSEELSKISDLASEVLPPQDAKAFHHNEPQTITLTAQTVAGLAAVDLELFKRAKAAFDAKQTTMTLTDEEARRVRAKRTKPSKQKAK